MENEEKIKTRISKIVQETKDTKCKGFSGQTWINLTISSIVQIWFVNLAAIAGSDVLKGSKPKRSNFAVNQTSPLGR